MSKVVAVPCIPTKLLAQCSVPKRLRRSTANVVLRYNHFSLVIRADRRMPLFTIVNIDGRQLPRSTARREKSRLSGPGTSIHAYDLSMQLDQDVFEQQKPQVFGRGHMVRRLDPAWGSPIASKQAADDRFNFANC